MYNSMKDWLHTPITILPYVSVDGVGDITYGVPINAVCFIQGKMQIVVDKFGKEVVSDLQVYLDGSTSIKVQDAVTLLGITHDIKALSPFYDDKGIVSLWVVYL